METAANLALIFVAAFGLADMVSRAVNRVLQRRLKQAEARKAEARRQLAEAMKQEQRQRPAAQPWDVTWNGNLVESFQVFPRDRRAWGVSPDTRWN